MEDARARATCRVAEPSRTRLSGGRIWWAHFALTRINIEPSIVRKKIEDPQIVTASWGCR